MNRYDVKVVDDNVESILRDAIAQYEKRTGKTTSIFFCKSETA